jgi:hypothetical protein
MAAIVRNLVLLLLVAAGLVVLGWGLPSLRFDDLMLASGGLVLVPLAGLGVAFCVVAVLLLRAIVAAVGAPRRGSP